MNKRFTNPYAVEIKKRETKISSATKDPKATLDRMFFQSICERLLDGAKQQIANYQYKLHGFQVGGGEIVLTKEGKNIKLVANNRADTTLIKQYLNEASIIASKF